MKVPSILMPFWHQNGGVLARCGMRMSSYLQAKMVLEVNNCGMLWWEVPNEGDCVEHYGSVCSESQKFGDVVDVHTANSRLVSNNWPHDRPFLTEAAYTAAAARTRRQQPGNALC